MCFVFFFYFGVVVLMGWDGLDKGFASFKFVSGVLIFCVVIGLVGVCDLRWFN